MNRKKWIKAGFGIMESDPKLIKNLRPIKLFKRWLQENKDKFTCKPYFFYRKKGRKKHLYLRYENIINNIVIDVSQNCWIEVRALNLKNIIPRNFNKDFADCTDLTMDFGIILKADKDGKYYNELHTEPISYDSIEEVYYEEFNCCFLEWSNSCIKEGNLLYLSWDEDWGIEDDRLINPEIEPEIYESYKDYSKKGNNMLLNISKKQNNKR